MEIAPKLTRRESQRTRKRRPTTITIPANVSPHVRLVFTEMQRQRRTYDEVEEESGILRTTLKAWRHKNRPGLESIEAVLGALGWDFVPVPRAKVLPKDLVADLAPIAERHGLSMAATLEVLVSMVARGRARAPLAPSTAPTLADLTA